MSEAREIRVAVRGGEIVGHVHGAEGPDVLLVPSVGSSELVWRHTAELLAADFRVVTFALRGHGRSTCELTGSLGIVLHDIAAVLDHVGMERPAIIGHTFGAGIAAMAAARFPGRFSAVGVVDSPMNLSQSEYREFLQVFQEKAIQEDLTVRIGLGCSGPDAESLQDFLDEYAPRLVNDWLALWPTPEHARAALEADTVVDETGAWQRRPTFETCRRYTELPPDAFAYPGRELLAALQLPIWVIQPVIGQFVDALDDVVDFARDRPGWQIRTIRGGIDALAHDDLAAELRSLLLGPAADNPNPIPA